MQPFEFRVPFHLKHEATLLKVEVSGVKSRKSMGADREAAPGYRRRGKGRESDEDDDDDLIDEDVDEAIVEDLDALPGGVNESAPVGSE